MAHATLASITTASIPDSLTQEDQVIKSINTRDHPSSSFYHRRSDDFRHAHPLTKPLSSCAFNHQQGPTNNLLANTPETHSQRNDAMWGEFQVRMSSRSFKF